MNIYFIALPFLYVISDFVVLLQTPEDDLQKPPSTTMENKYAPAVKNLVINPDLKSLWLYQPSSHQFQQTDELLTHPIALKSPHVLTKLAKPLSYGFDPFFPKPYFEPFERRQKPVTLVAFRKYGILPRKRIDQSIPISSEVAELQSSFNDISSFWQDDTFNL